MLTVKASESEVKIQTQFKIKYVEIEDFLSNEHYTLIKNLGDVAQQKWENGENGKISKNKILKNKVVSHYNLLTKEQIIDFYETYNERLLKILQELAPEKVKDVKSMDLNIVYSPPGFVFPIHNDLSSKLLSVVIYISPEHNYGTFLYNNEQGEKRVEVDWKQNKAFIFSRNDHSWHSYESSNLSGRLTLVINICNN
tara:strand:+ start:1906 stop:2496 length:591 start_codon:yes stop_codon:yes gene_type:complete